MQADTIVETLVVEGCRELGSESGAISLRVSDGWVVRCVHNMPSSLVAQRMSDLQERHAVLALETRAPVAVPDAFNDHRFAVDHLRAHNIRAVLVVPLILKGVPFGVLFLNFHSEPHEFTTEELAFAVQLATTASIALENARLWAELDDKRKSEKERADDSERLSRMMVGRELRMLELKEEVNQLCDQYGLPRRYRVTTAP